MPLPNPWRGLRGLPAEVWIVAVTTLMNRVGSMVLPFLALYLTQHLGAPARVAGFVLTAYGLGSLISAPLAGRLCDRVSPLRVMQGSLFLSGALLLTFPLVRDVAAVFALVVAWALVGEAVRPASLAALTGAIAPEQRKAAIALNRLAINLGMSVGPAVGGFLSMVSFPLLFAVDGATALAAGVVLTLLLRWRPVQVDPAAAELAVAAPSPRVLRDRRLLLFLLGVFLVGVVFLQHEAALPLFLVNDLHLPKSFFGMLFVMNTLMIVALEVPLNLAMGDWPHRRALVLGAALCAAGFGALALARGPGAVLLTVVVWTLGEMIFYPVSATYVADIAPPARRGAYLGAYSSTFGLSMLVGPGAGTLLLDRFGPATLWIIVLLVGVAAAAVIAVATRASAAEPAPVPLPAHAA